MKRKVSPRGAKMLKRLLVLGEFPEETARLWKEDLALRREELELSRAWLAWQKEESERKREYFRRGENNGGEAEGDKFSGNIAEEWYGREGAAEYRTIKAMNKSWLKIRRILKEWGYSLAGSRKKEGFWQAVACYNMAMAGRLIKTAGLLSALGYENEGSKQEMANTARYAVYMKVTGEEDE